MSDMPGDIYLRMVSGELAPDQAAEILRQRDQQAQTPYGQYEATLPDLEQSAMQDAVAMWNATGGDQVLPKYRQQNFQKMYEGILKNKVDAAKAGYTTARQQPLDEASLAKSNQSTESMAAATDLAKQKFGAQFGDAPIDYESLNPDEVNQALQHWDSDPNSHNAILDALSGELTGDKTLWTTNINTRRRVIGVIDYAKAQRDTAQQGLQQAQDTAMQSDRWGGLSEQERAKELWVKNNLDPSYVIGKGGRTYRSEAEAARGPLHFTYTPPGKSYHFPADTKADMAKFDQGTWAGLAHNLSPSNAGPGAMVVRAHERDQGGGGPAVSEYPGVAFRAYLSNQAKGAKKVGAGIAHWWQART